MIYVVLVIFAVPVFWLLGKFSKPASALAALIGSIISSIGTLTGSFETMMYGFGLIGFSVLVFLVFNGGKW